MISKVLPKDLSPAVQVQSTLTLEQAKTLFLFLNGYTLKQISFELNKSYRTTDGHIQAIKRKMKAKTHVGLAVKALQRGYLETPSALPFQGIKQKLTPRETEVLHYFLMDLRAKEVGLKMNISSKTVERYLLNIRWKWGVTEPVDMVIHAINRGYIILEKQETSGKLINLLPFIKTAPMLKIVYTVPRNS